jgi:hypothetical protein
MSDWLDLSDNANTLKSSYIQGVLDVSGDIIMRNSDQAFINMSDASFNRKFHALKNTAIGKEVDNLENALDVSGNIGITGSLVLEETPTIYSGSLNTDQLSIEGNLITTGGTAQVASKNVTYDTHLNVHGSTITANTSELNHMNKHLNKNNYLPEELMYIILTSSTEIRSSRGDAVSLSYDGDVIAFKCDGNVDVLIYRYMILTQTEWDERSKITTFPNSNAISNTIITSDSTLDTTKKYWTQLGSALNDSTHDYPGSYGVALSGNGERILCLGGGANEVIQVYEYSISGLLLGGTWNLISSIGSVQTDSSYHIIYSPAINYLGNRIACYYSHHNETGYTNIRTGKVFVYEYSGQGTTWNQIGSFIGPDKAFNGNWLCYEKAIHLNRSPDTDIDGTVISLLHRYNDDTLEFINDGWVETYEYDGTTWNARPNIYGFIPQVFSWSDEPTTVKQNYYEYIDLSEDGNYVMLCGRNSIPTLPSGDVFNSLTEPQSGHCIIFEYRLITQSEWDNGNTSDDYTPAEGVPVIMADGDTVLDINKKYWIQKGDCIFDTDYLSINSSAQFVNCQIRIHESGDLFAYFANENSYNEFGLYASIGAVHVFAFEGTNWTKKQSYYGTSTSNRLGDHFNVSGNGNRLFASTTSSPYNVRIQDIGYTPEIQYKYQIHNDVSMVNAAESFGEDVSLNAALTVPGNILIVDSSNSEYNYGAYTIHTDETYTNYFAVGKSASNVFNIVNNNNAGVYMDSGSNSFTGTSDERLKKNIEEIGDESNEKVKQLRPVTYQWKHQTHNKSQAGFIAQEVEKVLPELVKENDSVDGSSYKGVSSDDLIPYLVKYVQKLRKKLEILKETKLKKSVSLSEISVSTNGGSITPSPFSSTDELK